MGSSLAYIKIHKVFNGCVSWCASAIIPAMLLATGIDSYWVLTIMHSLNFCQIIFCPLRSLPDILDSQKSIKSADLKTTVYINKQLNDIEEQLILVIHLLYESMMT